MGCPPWVWVGEDTEGVGASADVAVKALARGVVANLGPYPGREGREREDVCPGLIEVITHGGELVVDVVHEPVGLARQVLLAVRLEGGARRAGWRWLRCRGRWQGRWVRGRPTGGWREACWAWPGFETTRRAKLAARAASGRAGLAPRGGLAAGAVRRSGGGAARRSGGGRRRGS